MFALRCRGTTSAPRRRAQKDATFGLDEPIGANMMGTGVEDFAVFEDRLEWGRKCFEALAAHVARTPPAPSTPTEPGAQATRAANAARTISTPPVGRTLLDRVGLQSQLATAEIDLLWLLACCELDPDITALVRQAYRDRDYDRPALSYEIAKQLVAVGRTPAVLLEKSAVRRLYATGLVEDTPDFRFRLNAKLIASLRAEMRRAESRMGRGSTPPTYPSALEPDQAPAFAVGTVDTETIEPASRRATTASGWAKRVVTMANGLSPGAADDGHSAPATFTIGYSRVRGEPDAS